MSTETVEIISRYSRAQAIEDGVLVEIPTEKTMFKWPVAFTVALWAEVKRQSDPDAWIWDVCWMSLVYSKRQRGADTFFPCILGRKTHHLWANAGPGDNGEPVITIGYPEDR